MKSASILIVDDDKVSTSILSEILKLKGFEVDVSVNGIEAITMMANKRYNGVILDYLMPYLNGEETAEKIKDMDPGVGIVLITGHKGQLNERKLSDFDLILEKPLHPDKVVEALSKVLAHKASQRPSLLLVDDDKSSTRVLSEILEVKGFDVDVTTNGIDAIEKTKRKRYAVTILDYLMPYLNGDEVARRIRESNPEAGIVLITGHKGLLDERAMNDKDLNNLRLNGFDLVLEKPADPDQIIKAVRKVISRKEMQNKALEAPIPSSTQ